MCVHLFGLCVFRVNVVCASRAHYVRFIDCMRTIRNDTKFTLFLQFAGEKKTKDINAAAATTGTITPAKHGTQSAIRKQVFGLRRVNMCRIRVNVM